MIWIVLIEGGFAQRCHHHGYPFPTPTPTPTYETWKKGNHYRTYFPAPSWCESTLSYRRQAGTSYIIKQEAEGARILVKRNDVYVGGDASLYKR